MSDIPRRHNAHHRARLAGPPEFQHLGVQFGLRSSAGRL